MNKKGYRQSVLLHGMITFNRPVKILAERFIPIEHEGRTTVAIFIYQPEDLVTKDEDEFTGKTKWYRSGQIRYMVAIDGRQNTDGIVDHWGGFEDGEA